MRDTKLAPSVGSRYNRTDRLQKGNREGSEVELARSTVAPPPTLVLLVTQILTSVL